MINMYNKPIKRGCCPSPQEVYKNKDKLGFYNTELLDGITRSLDAKFVEFTDNTAAILGDIKTALQIISGNNGSVGGGGNNGSVGGTPGGSTPPVIPEVVKYTVSFNSNGATGGTPPTSVNIAAGTYTTDSLVTLHTLEKTGYVLLGWNTDISASVPLTNIVIAENIILYAIWKVKDEEVELSQMPAPNIFIDSDTGKLRWSYFDNMSHATVIIEYSTNGVDYNMLLSYNIPEMKEAYPNDQTVAFGYIDLANYLKIPGTYYIYTYAMAEGFLNSERSMMSESYVVAEPEEEIIILSTPVISLTYDDFLKITSLDSRTTYCEMTIVGNSNTITANITDFQYPIDLRSYLSGYSAGSYTISIVAYGDNAYSYTSNSVVYGYSATCNITFRGFDTEEDGTGLGKDGDIEIQYIKYGSAIMFQMKESSEEKTVIADIDSPIQIRFLAVGEEYSSATIRVTSENYNVLPGSYSMTTDGGTEINKTFTAKGDDILTLEYHVNS